MSEKPSFVYVIYIASTPEGSPRADFGGNVEAVLERKLRRESDWKVGSSFALRLPRHERSRISRARCWSSIRRAGLVYTSHPHHGGMEDEGASRVVFEIEPPQDQVTS